MSLFGGGEEVKEGEWGNIPGPSESSTGLGGACAGQMSLPQLKELSGVALS